MKCVYCQNWQISQKSLGQEASLKDLVEKMLHLQEMGCHNINLVSPTQYASVIVESLKQAKDKGLYIPIVYNTNGYDRLNILKMFDGLVDIYLPDIKYSDNKVAYELSGVKNYVDHNRAAIAEMFRQVGNLQLDRDDIAKKGLLVRHLVLPNGLAGSYESLKFLAGLSKGIWISVMAQYNPCYKALNFPEINRKLTKGEYNMVVQMVEDLGFENYLNQELESSSVFNPDFEKSNPFIEGK